MAPEGGNLHPAGGRATEGAIIPSASNTCAVIQENMTLGMEAPQ